MHKKKIVFRADGNSEIGLGHIIRCLALADMLKKKFECEFATRFITDFVKVEINKSCTKIYHLPESEQEHYDYFLKKIKGDEIVVLDNYFFSTNYQNEIKEKGCKLVCIDDMHDKHYVADLVINHSPGLSEKEFLCTTSTKLCLGLDYVLLRSPFLEQAKKKSQLKEINTAFVCFGGSDSLNLTCKVVKFLLRVSWVEEINVLIGDAYNYRNELNELIRDSQIINLYQNLDSFGVIQLMQKSNFAVVPASTLLFETLSTKLPSITGYYVDNQKQFEKGVSEISNVESVGDFTKMKYVTFAHRVNSLKKNYSFEIDCIDGRSGERLLNIFESL